MTLRTQGFNKKVVQYRELWDQFRFLGNCPTTIPYPFLLNVGLGEG